MNSFTAAGRLGRDAELKTLASGMSVAEIAIAVDTGFGDRKATMWVRGKIWGKRAESGLIQYLVKGKQVAVTGELSESKWAGKDGVERTSLELNIDRIDLVGGGDGRAQPAPQQQAPVTAAPDFDDDLAF